MPALVRDRIDERNVRVLKLDLPVTAELRRACPRPAQPA